MISIFFFYLKGINYLIEFEVWGIMQGNINFLQHFACFCIGILTIAMENMSLARLLET